MSTPNAFAFAIATPSAASSRSSAMTSAAPRSFAPIAKIPVPHPASSTFFPAMSPFPCAKYRTSAAMSAGVWYCSSVGFGLGCGRTFCRRISSSRCFTRRRKCGPGVTGWAPLGWGPWGLRIADLSQDGTPEIVVSNLGSLRIYNGVTHAELENVTVGTHSDPWGRAVAIADVDGGGLALEWDSTQLGAPWPGGVLGASIEALEVADVDADGTIEIVALDIESGVYVLSPAGDSYAVERWQGVLSCRTCTALAVADVDGGPGLEGLTARGGGLRV